LLPIRVLASLLIPAGLTGCASYGPLPLENRPALAESIDRLGVEPGQQPLSVAEVARLAVVNNPDLRAMRAQHGVAQAQLLQAGLLPNPNMTGAILPLAAGQGETFAWNAGISIDVKSLITLSARKRSAAASARQVDAQILWQEWQITGQARLLSVDLIEGDRLLLLFRRQRELLEGRVALSRGAVAAGNETITALAPDVAALQSVRVQVNDQERLQLSRRHQLAALLGLLPDAPLKLAAEPDLPPLDLAAVEQALSTLPERRPDLAALRLGYDAQDAKVRAAILAQFPNLSFGITGGSDNSNIRNVGPQITLELPVFDRNQGNIAIERATRQQLNDEYAARLTAADGQVRAMASEIAQLRAQRARAEADRATTQRLARQADAAFAAGNLDERGYVDLITTDLGKQEEIVALQQSLLEQEEAIDTLIGAGMPNIALPAEARS
jgi:outer membrane protein TolC